MSLDVIADSCQKVRAAALDALVWAANPQNERKLSQNRSKIERVLRRNAAEAERLQHTLAKPGCVGVFGPSQAGKSYLISVLARPEGEDALIAKFSGAVSEVDFIKSINPLGGEEATGLVTRFTMHSVPAPEGYPVCLRLLSQSDILKILVNSYLQDGDQEFEEELGAEALDAHLRSFDARCAASAVDVLRNEDIWDLQEYVTRNASGAFSARAVDSAWPEIARLAPLLGIADRGRLLSILWGRHQAYTDLFVMLADALAHLGFATEAFCSMESLLPATEGILNVRTLEFLLSGGGDTLSVITKSGVEVSLPRSLIAALASELRIVCRDEPHGFFRHTDLLDFPGYRSRTRQNLGKYIREAPTAAKELFLRGKVDYLFQSYTANLELTSLILCLPDSNLEVTSLPKAIEQWIGVTHGGSPEKRRGKPTLLFFALTKFDRHLMESAGEEGNDPALRFEIRLNASLLTPFAKTESSWPRQWIPGQPFNNLFWIRNPNFKAEHVITYVDRREVEVISQRLQRITQLRDAFTGSALVRAHFSDPVRSWDEVMKLNDGGVSYLADAISAVATEDLKFGQIAARLAEIRREAYDLLHVFYIDDDYAARRAQRLAVVDEQIFVDFNYCAEKTAFGTALRGLMVDASDFYGAFWHLLNQAVPQSLSQAARGGGLFTGLVKPQEAGAPAGGDRWSRIGIAALDYWTNLMFERADDPAFARRVGISSDTLKEIVAEFGQAARRVKLDERIAEQMRERSTPNENLDVVVRKIGQITERVINRFVAQMDLDAKSAQKQIDEFGEDLLRPVFPAKPIYYDLIEMPAERPDFAIDFMIGWGAGFRAIVARNATTLSNGLEDPVQNARLGEILQALTP